MDLTVGTFSCMTVLSTLLSRMQMLLLLTEQQNYGGLLQATEDKKNTYTKMFTAQVGRD